MSKTPMIAACFALAALLVSGCGKDCKGMCTDLGKCANATTAAKNRDCAAYCTSADNIAKAGSCTDKWNTTMTCEEGLKDICNATDWQGCGISAGFANCVVTYCSQGTNQTGADCTAVMAL